MARKARKGTMEFLLINHPLDCPICDQGGECDLQDQAMAYGADSSRFSENKRAVEDKYIGPLVKTSMNRCIQCTRCVRFVTEVAGVPELGAIGRGEDMEITSYLEHAMTSELQGNVVDLCPVGALTSKPTAFHARPWEYAKTESIDVMDALGSAIRVDSRGREVVRILPRINDAINEEWISDKTRHVVDGLKTQRLDRPYVRVDGRLRPVSWAQAFAAIASKVAAASPSRIGAIVGDLATVEEMFALKSLLAKLGSPNIDCRQDGSKLHPKFGRASYLFNSTIAGIEQADAILIVGSNPRHEAAVLNARIRKRWLKGGAPIGVDGPRADLTYSYDYLGAGPETLAQALDKPPEGVAKPMIIVGAAAFARPDGVAVLASLAKAALAAGVVKDGWNGFNVLHTAASRVGGLDLGLVPGEGALDAPRWRRRVRSTCSSTSARTRSTSSRARSSSISARTAIAAPIARMSSCRARPTPKKPASTSTRKGGRSSPSARCSRPGTRARTGRSCARFRIRSARSCRSIRSRNCGRRSPPPTPSSCDLTPSRRRMRASSASIAATRRRGRQGAVRSGRP